MLQTDYVIGSPLTHQDPFIRRLPVTGRPAIWITVGQGPAALAVGAFWGCLDIFYLIYPFSSLSPSLWETARYRLKNCLKGPSNPKQPTNQNSSDDTGRSSRETGRPLLDSLLRHAEGYVWPILSRDSTGDIREN